MKRTLSKIICLNLALILLLSFAVTALAVETEEADAEEVVIPVEAPDQALAEDEYSAARAAAEAEYPRPETLRGGSLLTSPGVLGDEETYTIRVGDVSFESDQEASGAGWSYKDEMLVLDNYNGGPIAASGDLMVYTKGTVIIQGKSPEEGEEGYGYEGIDTMGLLDLTVGEGTLTINGGSGSHGGGHGIRSDGNVYLFLSSVKGSTAAITGGSATVAGNGGHGIQAAGLSVYGNANAEAPCVTITGGSAPFLATAGTAGGAGVITTSGDGQLSLYAATEIRGGDGTSAAPAILYFGKCWIDRANITLYSGINPNGEYSWPILRSKTTENWQYNGAHMSFTMDDEARHAWFQFRVHRYLLELRGGDDGWYGGATFTDLRDYYPTSYRIGDFAYKRAGYSLVSWTNRAKDRIVYLDRMYTPDEDTTLWADWVPTAAGDILLNGMGGRVEQDDSDFWRRYSGTSVTLPEHLWFQGYDSWVDRAVFGWHTTPSLTTDENNILNGVWYAGGSEIAPDETKTTELHAFCDPYGQAIVYHTTEGTRFGGDIFVQRVSSSDLKGYVRGCEDYMTAPEGCIFVGWAEEPGGEVKYAVGDKVTADYGVPTHLYAVWKSIGGRYSLPEKCEALVDPKSETITVTPAKDWTEQLKEPQKFFGAIYDENGRMIAFGFIDDSGGLAFGFDGKHLPLLKVFGLTADDAPAGENIRMDLREMEPEKDDDAPAPTS